MERSTMNYHTVIGNRTNYPWTGGGDGNWYSDSGCRWEKADQVVGE